VCIPQPEVNYRANGRMPNSTVAASINPRSDGITVGNMMERGNWSLEPNEEVLRQNVDAAMKFFASMRAPSAPVGITRSNPPQSIPPVESFFESDWQEFL
jgi:hypothetical protein